MIVDLPFLLASAAFGFGFSLMVYRWLAIYNDWPMGYVHARQPVVPVFIGILAMATALAFAAFRGAQFGGWAIIVFGLLLALFWLGFFRVASQVGLFLAPGVVALLLFAWFGTPSFFHAAAIENSGGERIVVYPKGYRDTPSENRYENDVVDRSGRLR